MPPAEIERVLNRIPKNIEDAQQIFPERLRGYNEHLAGKLLPDLELEEQSLFEKARGLLFQSDTDRAREAYEDVRALSAGGDVRAALEKATIM